jgi:hypothetical protein
MALEYYKKHETYLNKFDTEEGKAVDTWIRSKKNQIRDKTLSLSKIELLKEAGMI